MAEQSPPDPDEPTSMLGSDEIDQLYKAVVRLRDVGTAILFITHKHEAIRFGDESRC